MNILPSSDHEIKHQPSGNSHPRMGRRSSSLESTISVSTTSVTSSCTATFVHRMVSAASTPFLNTALSSTPFLNTDVTAPLLAPKTESNFKTDISNFKTESNFKRNWDDIGQFCLDEILPLVKTGSKLSRKRMPMVSDNPSGNILEI